MTDVTTRENVSTDLRRERWTATETAAVVLAVLAFAAAFTWLGPVLRPFLLAVFLYYVAQFGAKTLARFGLGPRAAYASLVLLAALVTVLFGQLVSREATIFLRKWPQYETRITKFINSLPQLDRFIPDSLAQGNHAAEKPRDQSDYGPPSVAEMGTSETQGTTSPLTVFFRELSQTSLDYVFRHSLDVAETFLLVVVYAVFLFVGSRKLPSRLCKAFPGERGDRLLLMGEGIARSMESFMAVKTVVGLGMGASAGLLMFLFGLDHWLLWAFLFFASNYITYIGSIAACVPPVILAFVDLKSPVAAVALAILLVLNRLVWIDFVEIRMSGKQLNLDPALMFLWLSYWGWVWGVLGLLLAYPMLAAVKIVLTHTKDSAGWAVLLSDD